MRVTNQMIANHAIEGTQRNLDQLYALQEKIASAKQIQRASEDPAKMASVLDLHSVLQRLDTFSDVANSIQTWLSENAQVFQQMEDLVTKANNLLLQASSDTLSDSAKKTLGDSMQGLLDQAMEAANSSSMGSYLFAGFQVKTQPFSIDPVTQTVLYHGDDGAIHRAISPQQTVQVNFNGQDTFGAFLSTLQTASTALHNQDFAAVPGLISDLQHAPQTIQTAHTLNGNRQNQVDGALTSLSQSQLNLKGLLSAKEDTNVAEAMVALSTQQTVYNSTLAVAQRAGSILTLFDLLR
jgi:flagellar hook-associated protein 3 FlgL